MPSFNPHQFGRVLAGDDHDAKDKRKLLKQLGKNFPDDATSWVNDPAVHVQRTYIRPVDVDWDHRSEWAATHQPGKVAKVRKKIEKGKDRPVVAIDRPGSDNVMIADGHHDAEAYTQLDRSHMPAYVVRVPTRMGPWDEMHTDQRRK